MQRSAKHKELDAEMKSIGRSIAQMDEQTTVELGCLCYIMNSHTNKLSNHRFCLQTRMNHLISTYLEHDTEKIERVTRVVVALEQSCETFRYLESLPV